MFLELNRGPLPLKSLYKVGKPEMLNGHYWFT